MDRVSAGPPDPQADRLRSVLSAAFADAQAELKPAGMRCDVLKVRWHERRLVAPQGLDRPWRPLWRPLSRLFAWRRVKVTIRIREGADGLPLASLSEKPAVRPGRSIRRIMRWPGKFCARFRR